ncbi:unnamed protein product [Natator depressus]
MPHLKDQIQRSCFDFNFVQTQPHYHYQLRGEITRISKNSEQDFQIRPKEINLALSAFDTYSFSPLVCMRVSLIWNSPQQGGKLILRKAEKYKSSLALKWRVKVTFSSMSCKLEFIKPNVKK